ncbi:MAG TPA: TlpA disulfide reductase family protein [Candidatus Thermoplasmatota archaeon]|nr:TlpA disulfide reductase family protein [Candidatus Thermoplasmatota archaeon]
MRAALLALAFVLPVVAGCLQGDPPTPASDAMAVPWSFTDTEGIVRSANGSAGKPTLLFFMATWCSTCKSKSPMLKNVAEAYAGRVNVYSVSVDETDTDGKLEAWREAREHPWPHGRAGEMTKAFGVRLQSTFVLLSAEGEVLRKWDYPGASEEDLRGSLEKALSG